MIDCVLVGHNQIEFDEYADYLEKMGSSCALDDFRLNYFKYEGNRWHLAKTINTLRKNTESAISLNLNSFYFSNTIAYLGSFLNRNNLTFDYVHSFQQDKFKLRDMLIKKKINCIAITTTYYLVVEPIKEIVEFIKKYNPNVKIIVGGPFIANQVVYFENTDYLYSLFDEIGADIYINSNQGEKTLLEVINYLKKNLKLYNISNIYFKEENKYKYLSSQEEENILANNPVKWSLFEQDLNKCVNIRSSISCPYSCKFCGFHIRGGKFQRLKAQILKNELDCLSKIKKVKYLNFVDDLFDVPLEILKDTLKMMIRENYNYKWSCQLRCSSLDDEAVKLLKEAGCISVFLGLESGSDKILLNMNKKAIVSDYNKGINLLKKNEITIHGNFITGFPGENEHTIRETVEFIKNSGIDYYRTQLWYYDQVTPIYNERHLYGLTGSSFEWEHNTMNSKEASHIIFDIFRNLKYPIWIPQDSFFSFDSLLELYDFGFDNSNIKLILSSFKEAVCESLTNSNGNIGTDMMLNLCKAINIQTESTHVPEIKKNIFNFE